MIHLEIYGQGSFVLFKNLKNMLVKLMQQKLKYELTIWLYNAGATTYMLSLMSEKFGSDGCFLLPS